MSKLIEFNGLSFVKDNSPNLDISLANYSDVFLALAQEIQDRQKEFGLTDLNLVLAGGAVRDIILGQRIKDFDFFLLGEDADEDNAVLLCGSDSYRWLGNEEKYRGAIPEGGEEKDRPVFKVLECFPHDFLIPVQYILRPQENTVEELLNDVDYDLVRLAIPINNPGVIQMDERAWNCFRNKTVDFPTRDSYYRGFWKIPKDWKVNGYPDGAPPSSLKNKIYNFKTEAAAWDKNINWNEVVRNEWLIRRLG